MRFGVLGPLTAWTDDGAPVDIPGAKVRALLADLLVHAGEVVSADRLIDDLWGPDPPRDPAGGLQAKVSQLRKALDRAEPGARSHVVSRPPGYQMGVDPEAVDAGRFATLTAHARSAPDPATAARLLGEALTLWRGDAFADFADEDFARSAVTRLAEQRLTALEDHFETRLALGEHGSLIGALGTLVREHPLRERLCAAQMRALYRAGRQAEALEAYARLRRSLADELGLDPSPDLVRLQQAVLAQDPALDLPTGAPAWVPRAEPPAAVPVERDTLLSTKLHVPRPRQGSVPRARLTERLSAARGPGLVVVSTPAGFGKSTLLADWVRRGERPVAWLSLDEGDNDPTRFWRHLAAALDGVRPGVADRVAALLGAAHLTSLNGVVTVLLNELAARPDAVVLVIDDYHLVEAPLVHQSVAFLLEHLPPALLLVLASRTDPPLPLARLRAGGQLTELRAADLRLTPAESADLLQEAVGPDLPPAAVAALVDRTEGWVAGLQLAALSLHGRGDVAGFVEEFSGSHRYVLDYLTQEVLDRQSEPVRAFLLETAVLERLSGPLCDAVRGRTDSQGLLEEVERSNLFLVPLDDVRRWWRYHHLFADLLRVRLRQLHPGRVTELHGAAAAWCEHHDLPDDAVRHALAAGDAERATRTVERYLDEQILRRNEGATLARWLTDLNPEVVHRRPRLILGQAVTALLGGRLDEVEALLAVAERAAADTGDEPYEPSIGRSASILANIPAVTAVCWADLARLRGEPDRECDSARQALAHLTDEDVLLGSIARYHVAVADWLDGQLPEAERALSEVFAQRSASGERHMALRVCYDLGSVQQARGRLDTALRSYRRGLDIAAGDRPLPSAGMAHVGLAEVLYERDDLDNAGRHVSAGVAMCRQLAYAPPLVTGLLTLARIRQAQGDGPGALDALGEAEEVMPQVVDLRNPVLALRAQLALTDGDVAEAARWVRSREIAVDDEPVYRREREYLVLARVLLAERALAPVLGLLARWHALAAAQGRTGSVIEFRILQARALAAAGDERQALGVLAQALALAAPQGYLRVFVDEGAPVAALLRGVAVRRAAGRSAGRVAADHLHRLLAAFTSAELPVLPAGVRSGAATGIITPLSKREMEVLARLATGLPNQAIATELVITLDTVKRHVSHILDKLGVGNRTHAVARARELGLLPG